MYYVIVLASIVHKVYKFVRLVIYFQALCFTIESLSLVVLSNIVGIVVIVKYVNYHMQGIEILAFRLE